MKLFARILVGVVLGAVSSAQAVTYPFQNPSLSLDERVSDLVSQLTLAEKAAQLGNSAPAIPRLEIAGYEYWNEALHGVVDADCTSFPQPIALSSTWDPDLAFSDR